MTDTLRRRIGPGLLTAYGVGVMVGAGIYVLVGAVAGAAGVWAPLAFLMAGLVAIPTALSFAEFSARIPEAAGEAAYVSEGLRRQWLTLAVGLAVVVAGTISGAAVLRGGVAYLTHIVPIADWAALLALGLILTGVAIVGVLESMALVALFTAVEVGGLALVVWAGMTAPPVEAFLDPPDIPWSGVGFGAVLAFFAFIGFEDIVNMAEETRDPRRTLPRSIIAALIITTLIYAAVSWATLRAVPAEALAASEAPLVLVWQAGTGQGAAFLSLVAVAAALNGILAQIVMASRVLYGLGGRVGGFVMFRAVHPRFGTPLVATALVGAGLILAAMALPVVALAGLTSAILLAVFALVNLSLILLKRRGAAYDGFTVPIWVPVAGFVLSLLALVVSLGGA